MKKIKPKLPLEKEKTRSFYRYDTGHYSFNTRKTNMVCQNPNCKYTSRVFIRTDFKIDEDYHSSKIAQYIIFHLLILGIVPKYQRLVQKKENIGY